MAAVKIPESASTLCFSPSAPFPFSAPPPDLHRIFRAHATPLDWRRPERTVYIEAWCAHGAKERMAQAIAALDWCTREDAAERLYNIYSARELLENGVSADPLTRLFETGWCGGRAVSFVTHPLILVEDAGPLLRAWAAIDQAGGS
jgi:hypothetical protein